MIFPVFRSDSRSFLNDFLEAVSSALSSVSNGPPTTQAEVFMPHDRWDSKYAFAECIPASQTSCNILSSILFSVLILQPFIGNVGKRVSPLFLRQIRKIFCTSRICPCGGERPLCHFTFTILSLIFCQIRASSAGKKSYCCSNYAHLPPSV